MPVSLLRAYQQKRGFCAFVVQTWGTKHFAYEARMKILPALH